jgi:hypothetical protein
MIKHYRDISEVRGIYLHCTGTTQDATVEAIQRYWRDVLEWKTPIGYHYIVPPDGKTQVLANLDVIVNGIYGYNRKGVHLSYIGGRGGVDDRTPQQKSEMERIVKNLLKPMYLGPNMVIRGHRDMSPDRDGNGIITPDEFLKQCPSFSVSDWLREIGLSKYAY